MKIVIIDDDPSISFLLSEILKIWNHNVENFTSPVQALEFIKSEPIDIVFTDYIMDDLSGKDVYNEVSILDNETKVIITTALNKENVIEETGCETILEKPFKMVDVKNLMESLH